MTRRRRILDALVAGTLCASVLAFIDPEVPLHWLLAVGLFVSIWWLVD